MRIRVLGCHGGATPDHRTTCFMLGDHVALAAGSLCTGLTLEEQFQVEDVILTHAHLDHIQDLPKLADNVSGRRSHPVSVHCATPTAEALRKHVFNNVIWPDFCAIPSVSNPTLKVKSHPPLRKFMAQNLEITFVAMKHSVDSQAVLVKAESGVVAFSGDSGPGGGLWEQVNKLANVRALFVECSFPNSQQRVADASGHFTPSTLAGELKKLTVSGFPVIVYHLKPATYGETRRELRALRQRELSLARNGDVYEV
jgi:cAMP phosphodiesterase